MKTKTAKEVAVEEIRLVHAADDCPDLSDLGEYSSTPKPPNFIDRKERGDQGRNEFQYFNLGCGDPEYLEQDYKRAEAYNKGDWYVIGIYAEAVLIINGTQQRIRTAGLWGIESDSGDDYFAEVGQEELYTLGGILKSIGVEMEMLKAKDVKVISK